MTLVFIGSSNWDIYDGGKGRLSAIPKPGVDAGSSHFCDRDHIKQLMNQGYFNDTPTEAGLELMEGIHTSFCPNGGKFITF
jgi:hypothetical protein